MTSIITKSRNLAILKRALPHRSVLECETLLENCSEEDLGSPARLAELDKSLQNLFEETHDISIGDSGKVKCIKFWGACQVGKIYTGKWKQAAFSHQLRLELGNLPLATIHPSIFFDKNTKQINITKNFSYEETA